MCPDTYGLKDQGGVLRHTLTGLSVMKGGGETIIGRERRVLGNLVTIAPGPSNRLTRWRISKLSAGDSRPKPRSLKG